MWFGIWLPALAAAQWPEQCLAAPLHRRCTAVLHQSLLGRNSTLTQQHTPGPCVGLLLYPRRGRLVRRQAVQPQPLCLRCQSPRLGVVAAAVGRGCLLDSLLPGQGQPLRLGQWI